MVKAKLKYQDAGEVKVTGADDWNIPVKITINAPGPIFDKWTLTADCYQPRRDKILQWGFRAEAEDKETLVALVNKYWKPFYEKAMKSFEMVPDEDGNISCGIG